MFNFWWFLCWNMMKYKIRWKRRGWFFEDDNIWYILVEHVFRQRLKRFLEAPDSRVRVPAAFETDGWTSVLAVRRFFQVNWQFKSHICRKHEFGKISWIHVPFPLVGKRTSNLTSSGWFARWRGRSFLTVNLGESIWRRDDAGSFGGALAMASHYLHYALA